MSRALDLAKAISDDPAMIRSNGELDLQAAVELIEQFFPDESAAVRPPLEDYKLVRGWLWKHRCGCGRKKLGGNMFCTHCFKELPRGERWKFYEMYRRPFIRASAEEIKKRMAAPAEVVEVTP